MHKLYWAKQLKFGGGNEDTLNYNIRILGRRGVLVLNAVAAMSQLPEIERNAPKILAALDFNPGNRYADFSEASGDKVASYGIAALVAGGVAAKLGLFKGLWVLLLGAKKFVIIGVVALEPCSANCSARTRQRPNLTATGGWLRRGLARLGNPVQVTGEELQNAGLILQLSEPAEIDMLRLWHHPEFFRLGCRIE